MFFKPYTGRAMYRPAIRLLLYMKLTVMLCIAAVLQTFASVKAQKITVNAQHETLKKVMKSIQKQQGYRFFFRGAQIANIPITARIEEASLQQAMDMIVAGKNLQWTLVDKMIVIREAEKTVPVYTYVQHEITGVVQDNNGKPIAGVTVQIKGTSNRTQTDASGRFKLSGAAQAILQISSVGYMTQELSTNGKNTIQVVLQNSNMDIGEVVVIGYGSVKKSDLTGSVSSIGSSQITQVNTVSNVAQALQGQAAGVRVNQASGQPGEAMKIQIRGINSLSASNDPLYVVDGMPLDGLSAQLNPEDIENISVLKDASSTAIYGSRGANGVIMITTKKGKSGKTQIGYSNYFGVQNLRKRIDVLNAQDFANLQNEVTQNNNITKNENKPLPWTDEQIRNLGKGTDWQDLVYRSAMVQNHDLNLSGGNDATKYYTSFGYLNQDGIIRNSGFQRLSFRGNIEHRLWDRVTFATSMSLQNSKYNKAQYQSADGGGGIPWSSMVLPPTMQVYDQNGNYTKFTGVSWGETNPVGLSENWNNTSNNLRIIGNASLAVDIMDGLKLKSSIGIDQGTTKNDIYYPGNISLGQRTDENKNPIFGVARKEYGSSVTIINENILEYQKNVGQHSINAVAGFTYQKSKSDNLNSREASGFVNDLFENNAIGSAIVKAQPTSDYLDNKLISYLGRINYGFADRYFLTLTGRYDGSSRFGFNQKFAFFPSAALAWNVHKEEFLKDQELISQFKIRGSYGKSGNQGIGNYQTLANVRARDVVFDNKIGTGFYLSSMDNPNLRWESTKQMDLGLELGFLDNRIQVVADYYNKRTEDLLLNVTLPGSSGFSSVLQNIGVVQNRGFEFQVSARPNIGEGFTWNTSLNLSANRTKVLDIGLDAYGQPITYKEIGTGGNWFPTIVGQSMMQLYGFTVEGTYKTDQEAKDNGEPDKRAGDYRFKNWDGQGLVSASEDRTVISHLEPKFTFGFNNRFTYKNIDFSFLIVGSYGNDIVNEFRKYNISLNGNWNPTYEAYNNRWRGTGDAQFDRPSEKSGSAIRDYANSLWVENGSYLRLRDVTIGYTFPKSLLQSWHLSNLRVYLSAQNYLTITKYSGYDPEVSWGEASVNGWDRGNYPAFKSITAGLRVNF